ncbi:MAG: LppX_LprAFG lipoprotein [Nocardioidaceae bacterium]
MAGLTLALVAGCGSGDEAGTAESPELTKANFTSKVLAAQRQAETAHLEAKIGAQGQEMSMVGDMDLSNDDVAFDLSLSGGAVGGEARFILVDKIIYLKVPGLSQGGKFIKIDPADGSNPAAEMFSQMLSRLDPSKTFKAFDSIAQLKQAGTEEVDGVETTRYKVSVDTEKALKAQGLGGQVPPGQLPKTLEYDVWVDSDNLVRKLSTDVQGSSIDMTISEWGEPVDVAAPPSDQITEMPQMTG